MNQPDPQKNNNRHSWSNQRGFADPQGGSNPMLVASATVYLIILLGMLISVIIISLQTLSPVNAPAQINQPKSPLYIDVRDYTADSYGYPFAKLTQQIKSCTALVELSEDGSFDTETPCIAAALDADGTLVAASPRLLTAERVRVRAHNGKIYAANIIGYDRSTGITVLRASDLKLQPAGLSSELLAGDRVVCCLGAGGTAVYEEADITSEPSYSVYRLLTQVHRGSFFTVSGRRTSDSGSIVFDKVGQIAGFSAPNAKSSTGSYLSAEEVLASALSITQNGAVTGRRRVPFSAQPLSEPIDGHEEGLVLTYVEPSSQLSALHLHEGDLLLSVNGTAPASQDDVWDAAAEAPGAAAVFYSVETGHTVSLQLIFPEVAG